MRLGLRVDVTNRLPAMTARLGKDLDAAVRKSALAVETEAKQRATVDTGAMRASIYAKTSRETHGPKARSEAGAMRVSAKTGRVRKQAPRLFPEIGPQKPGEAVVAVGVEYGGIVEFGIGKGEAKPYLRPALEKVKPMFESAVADAIERAAHGRT